MFFFFFSSRRRHTRFSRDWSSDVCSSDLLDINRRLDRWLRIERDGTVTVFPGKVEIGRSEERRVGKSVDLGGRRIIKKKKKKEQCTGHELQRTRRLLERQRGMPAVTERQM